MLFRTINTVLNTVGSVAFDSSEKACESFAQLFVDKISTIRANISISASNPVGLLARPDSCISAQFSKFEPNSLSELLVVVQHLKPSYCSLDVIPPRLLTQIWDVVGSMILSIINQSLSKGVVPSYFKHALVQPTLDSSVLNNYRPISKLPFLAKLLEKVVLNQLSTFLNGNNFFYKFPSGFRSQHSTETALLKVSNDLLLSVDAGNCAVLVLLDLSAAFDTVDQAILLDRLQEWGGIEGVVLNWISSYRHGRSFAVELVSFISSSQFISSGVPQGSVLALCCFLYICFLWV